MTKHAQVLVALNTLLLALLADPTVIAFVAHHPKAALAASVGSNFGHLLAKFWKG